MEVCQFEVPLDEGVQVSAVYEVCEVSNLISCVNSWQIFRHECTNNIIPLFLRCVDKDFSQYKSLLWFKPFDLTLTYIFLLLKTAKKIFEDLVEKNRENSTGLPNFSMVNLILLYVLLKSTLFIKHKYVTYKINVYSVIFLAEQL